MLIDIGIFLANLKQVDLNNLNEDIVINIDIR